ncbi:restriction endonuclease [Kitasatospora aburaviensis]|uniref:Restriction endonuclease n=1 Tax=Kitasatospora aburaviensis TaxID=67265 RepID=A0ABW1F9D2_9ACTN
MGSRRPPARRRRPGRNGGGESAVALLFGAALAVSLALALVRWLLAHWWIPVLLLVVGGAVAAAVVRARLAERAAALERQRRLHAALTGPGGLDHMGHRAFEFAVRDLMRRDGCRAEQVGGGGDQSADVLATDPMGRRWVLQCKHKQDAVGGAAVGDGVLYALVGTNERVHRAQVPVVVTNGRFSAPAVRWGLDQNVALVDRALLGRWASIGLPLWELLPRVPAPRSGRGH